MNTRPVSWLFALALVLVLEARPSPGHADDRAPLQLVGVTEVGDAVTAYLHEAGSAHVFTLTEGEKATANGWRLTAITRGTSREVVRIHVQREGTNLWLAVAGTASPPGAANTSTPADPSPIDLPVSPRGPVHDQLLYRSRLRPKPQARKALREVSELDPFPTRLGR